MAKFMAVVAEMELDQIKSRAQDGHKYLTQTALRWRGMTVPFGYRPYCIRCGETTGVCACLPSEQQGWKLEPDPVYAPILVQMVEMFLDGALFGQIVKWLNDSGVPTSADIAQIRYGKQPANAKWAAQSIRKIFTSRAMLGAIETSEVLKRDDETGRPVKRSGPKPLYDDNGGLLLRAKPIVSYEKWAKVQARLSSNPRVGKPHIRASPLLRVAYCGACESTIYVNTAPDRKGNRSYRYYVCRKSGGECPTRRFNADDLERELVAAVLDYAGRWPHMTPHVIPAQEFSGALAQAEDARANLLEALEAGAFKGHTDTFAERMGTIEQRIAELKDKPSRPAETTWKLAGRTVREYWQSLAPGQQWDYLRHMRVKVGVVRGAFPGKDGDEDEDAWERIERLSAETAELRKARPQISAAMLERSYEHRWQAVAAQYGDVILNIELGSLAELRDRAARYPQ